MGEEERWGEAYTCMLLRRKREERVSMRVRRERGRKGMYQPLRRGGLAGTLEQRGEEGLTVLFSPLRERKKRTNVSHSASEPGERNDAHGPSPRSCR